MVTYSILQASCLFFEYQMSLQHRIFEHLGTNFYFKEILNDVKLACDSNARMRLWILTVFDFGSNLDCMLLLYNFVPNKKLMNP